MIFKEVIKMFNWGNEISRKCKDSNVSDKLDISASRAQELG